MTEERTKQGFLPQAFVQANTLAEATYLAWLACADGGVRVPSVKSGVEEPPAFDTGLLVVVNQPWLEPRIFTPGIPGGPENIEAYIREVVDGVHDHWVGYGWDYTYHQRFVEQIPLMLARIRQTWLTKGRITSRDFYLTTGRWETDQRIDDPPCLQLLQVRLLPDKPDPQGKAYRLNLTVVFRSRDLGNAFLMNALAFIELQKRLAGMVSQELAEFGLEVSPGAYGDFSLSNHLYGKDIVNRNLLATLERMRREPWTNFAMRLNDYLPLETRQQTKHLLAAQNHYELITRSTARHSFAATATELEEAGIDWETFPYNPEWDL